MAGGAGRNQPDLRVRFHSLRTHFDSAFAQFAQCELAVGFNLTFTRVLMTLLTVYSRCSLWTRVSLAWELTFLTLRRTDVRVDEWKTKTRMGDGREVDPDRNVLTGALREEDVHTHIVVGSSTLGHWHTGVGNSTSNLPLRSDSSRINQAPD